MNSWTVFSVFPHTCIRDGKSSSVKQAFNLNTLQYLAFILFILAPLCLKYPVPNLINSIRLCLDWRQICFESDCSKNSGLTVHIVFHNIIYVALATTTLHLGPHLLLAVWVLRRPDWPHRKLKSIGVFASVQTGTHLSKWHLEPPSKACFITRGKNRSTIKFQSKLVGFWMPVWMRPNIKRAKIINSLCSLSMTSFMLVDVHVTRLVCYGTIECVVKVLQEKNGRNTCFTVATVVVWM